MVELHRCLAVRRAEWLCDEQWTYYYYFQIRAAAFKAYCAIWIRHSNFRHQGSPRVSPRKSTQRRKVELWAINVRKVCLNADFHVTFRDLLHAVKLRHGTDGFTFPPKKGVLRIVFALKFRRLRLGANPRTWVPKSSTLPLDHRSRLTMSFVSSTGFCVMAFYLFSHLHSTTV
jgi:hypothetical protein